MKNRVHIFFAFVVFSLFLFFSPARSDNANIIINEIAAYEQSGNEWVEIFNRGDDLVDLTGWKFWENNTNHALTLKQGNDFILDPGEFAVITQDDKNFLAEYPFVTSTVFDSSWSTLSEDGEDIGVKFGTGINDFVERFTYIGTDNFSLERRDPRLNDYTESNWVEHLSGNTVGMVNSLFVLPVEEVAPLLEGPVASSTVEVPEAVVTSSVPVEEFVVPIEEMMSTSTSSSVEMLEGVSSTPQEISTTTEEVTPDVVTLKQEVTNTEEETPAENDVVQAPIIFINEVLSNPNDGEKEWVELLNAGADDMILDGYTLSDGVAVIANPTGTIAAGGFFVVELKSSKLNNDGDAVVLKNVSGDVVEMLSFGSWNDGNVVDNAAAPQKGNSLMRKNAESTDENVKYFFETTSPTKGSENSLTVPVREEPTVSEETQTQNVSSGGSDTAHNFGALPVGSLLINELLSDPGIDNEEFVELYNKTNTEIDLSGVQLRDGGGTVTLLEGVVASHGFFIVEKPKGNLNNTGDKVFLVDPSGEVLDTVTYGSWNDGNTEDNAVVANDPMSLSRRVDGGDTDNDADDFVATLHITAGEPNSIDTPIVEDAAVVEVYAKLLLNEVLPNPVAEDGISEFIEVYNPTTSTVSLVGWKLSDKSSYYTIHEKVLLPGEYAVFLRSVTGISLNNTGGDEVRLFDPNGNLIDTLTYTETAEEGQSFGRDEKRFAWTTTPTTGQKNVVTEVEVLDDTETPGAETVVAVKKVTAKSVATKKVLAPKKKAVKKIAGVKIKIGVRVALSQIREQDKGTVITTTGTVAVIPGVLGSQYFYIVDDTSGIQIYMSKKDFPDLSVGDLLQVTGQVSESYGETRVNVSTKSQIDVLGHGDAPGPQSVELASIGESLEGAFVQSTAQVTDVKSGYLYIDDGSGEIKVYFKKGSGITRDDVTLGSTVQVRGIVSQAIGGYQILPRSKDDLLLVASSTDAVVATVTTSSSDVKNFVTALLSVVFVALIGLLFKTYKKKMPSE